jgi:hypothetical protein
MFYKDIRTAEQLNAMTAGQLKSYEVKLRRAAKRQGLILQRHRARDPYHLLYGTWQLVGARTGDVVWCADGADGYGLDLGQIAECLWETR